MGSGRCGSVRWMRLHLRVSGPIDGVPVLLIHGNCSSGGYWAPLTRRLPQGWRIVAPDLRGYGQSPVAPVDATRGLRDFSDDVAALLDDPSAFGPGARPVVVAHSMGAGVAMQLAVDHPGRVSALVLEAPLSPYGFGGTRDLAGTFTTHDLAGTGAGSVNAEFVKRLAAGDRSADDPASPRNVMLSTYVADPQAFGDDEEAMLDTVLSTAVGTDNYPGDATQSPNWPNTAPGHRGVLNAMSPRWFSVADDLVAMTPKPPIAWVRGDADAIVSDTSLFDLANLGRLGLVPGWPGESACPPQPMVSQTRAVLERYAASGGEFTEVVFEGCGHSPHIERTDAFITHLRRVVDSMAPGSPS